MIMNYQLINLIIIFLLSLIKIKIKTFKAFFKKIWLYGKLFIIYTVIIKKYFHLSQIIYDFNIFFGKYYKKEGEKK